MKSKDTLIVIPAYNEELHIANTIHNIINEINKKKLQNNIDLLVIDDCSTDKTAEILNTLNIHEISNLKHLGYASSLQVGYRYAVDQNYNYIIQMDSDGQHDASNITSLYTEIHKNKCDIVLGNRYVHSDIKTTALKKIATKYFRFLINRFSKTKINDPTTGLQALNKAVIYYYSKFNQFDSVFPDSNIILESLKAGFTIYEIPVLMHDRKDESKIFKGFKPVYYMLYMTIATISVNFKRDIKVRYLSARQYANGELNDA